MKTWAALFLGILLFAPLLPAKGEEGALRARDFARKVQGLTPEQLKELAKDPKMAPSGKGKGGEYSLINPPPNPTNLVPLVDQQDLMGSPKGPIPDGVIKKIEDRCLSKVPQRFTPDAHHTYCACSAAATQGTMRLGDLAEIQDHKKRVVGNKVFEKYVAEVVTPCMEFPVEEIEYLYCVLYKSNDYRISYIPSYCRCVGRGMREYLKTEGTSNIILELGNIRRRKDDPIQALWKSNHYQKGLENVRESCVGSYLKPDTPFKK